MTAQPMTAVDLFMPSAWADPYPLHERLRETAGGVHHVPERGAWLITRHADVHNTLRDRRFSNDFFNSPLGYGAHDPADPDHQRFAAIATRNFHAADGTTHDRLRGLVHHAFSGAAAQTWRPAIKESVEEVLDGLRPGQTDWVAEAAEPAPLLVICRLLGAPAAARQRIRDMSAAFAATFDITVMSDPTSRATAIHGSLDLFNYIRDLVDQRRAEPDCDDMLSTLLHAETEGDRLSRDELVATVALLIVSGHSTTIDAAGNAMALLLEHPDQLAALRADRTLMDNAVAEALRRESPIQIMGRVAATGIDLGDGRTIHAGAAVFCCLGAANRDPRAFQRPEHFDIRRPDARRHVAFGAGPHACIGGRLAHAQISALLNAVLDRYAITPAGPAVIRADRFLQRGHKTIPMTLSNPQTPGSAEKRS